MDPEETNLIESAFAGSGEMAGRMRALNWSSTPLGPVEHWPQALRTSVRIVLDGGYPMSILWGTDYTCIYNDTYIPLIGTKHPSALGRGARELFPETWDFIKPMFEKVVTEGQGASFLTDLLFPMNRLNYLEEVYVTFSVSPIPDDNGKVGGVLAIALETTERVLEERRRHLLSDLASRAAGARSEEEVWRVCAETLGEDRQSLPFAFLYEYRPSEQRAYLAGASVKTDETLCPPVIECGSDNLWRFNSALAKGGVLVELGDLASGVPVPNWPDAPKEAQVVPIRLGEYGEALGFLVAGIHPGRAFDDAYRQFVYRITEQIMIGLVSARGFEQERQTEREKLRASEQTLAETNRLYHEQQRAATELQIQVDLLQQLPVAMWTLMPDGTPDFVNRVWLEFAGQTLDFVRSNPEAWMNAVHPDDRERVIKTFWEGVSTGRGFVFENRSLRAQDRTYRWHLQQAVPLRDAEGNVLRFVGTTTDIDDQKRVEESLAALDRAKTTFFSNVSHEFRTPLTLMLGPLEEIQKDAREHSSPERHELLATVHRNGLRLLKLVNTLLDFSRIEAGRAQASYQPTDLATFTVEIASAFDSALQNAGLHFSIDCEPIADPVYVDRDMWEKIVLNLLSNAYKFTFEGEVALTLKQQDGAIELQVRDTGVGIPEEHRGQVFERFHRIENVQARTHEGTGIGLALVQELVKLHGGAVRVESEVGTGSTFTVTIPMGKDHLSTERIQTTDSLASKTIRADAYIEDELKMFGSEPVVKADAEELNNSRSPVSSAIPVSAGKPELIVLADDNADMRQYLSRLLGDQYNVHAVADGRQALEATQKLRPALVLADVMMPQLDGFGLLRAIREDSTLAGTPVILVSARAGEESRVEGLEADADDYLVKPFAARELLARVAVHVKMANLRRETAEREERLRSDAELEREKLRASEERLAETNRLYSELQRADAESRLQVALLQQLPVSAWTLKPDGTPDFVNDVWLQFAGQTLDFVRSDPEAWMTAVHPEDREAASKGFWEGVRSGNGFSFETRALRAQDGVYRWHLNQAVVLRDAEGKVLKFVGTTTDIDDQKRAEEKLRESEYEARLTVDSIPGLVALVSPNGNLEMVSRKALEFFGRSIEELRGWGTNDTIHPEDLPGAIEAFSQAIVTGSPYEFPARFRRSDGVYRWFQDRGYPLRDRNGEIVRWYLLITDIEDQKRAEEALRESEHESRVIVDTIPAGIGVLSASGELVRANQIGLEYYGKSLEELRQWTADDSLHPDDRSGYVQAVVQSLTTGDPFEYEARIRRFDGVYRWFQVRGRPLRDHQGQILRWYFAQTDLEDRKRAEEALRESLHESRLIVDSIPGQVAVLSPSGEVEKINQPVVDYFGKSLDELRQWAVDETVHPDDRPGYVQAFERSFVAGYPFEHAARIRRFDGVYRWFNTRGHPLRDPQGHIVRWYFLFIDVDDQKRAEEALRESEHESRMIVDSIPGMVAVLSASGEIERVSQPISDYYGKRKEELGQWSTDDTVHPDDRSGFIHAFGQSVALGDPIEYEARFRRFDGVYRWFQIRGLPLRDDQGQILRWYFLQIDIDDRKRAEDQVRRSEAYLEEAQQLTRIGSFSWRVEADEIAWSEQLYRIYGFEPGSPLTFERIRDRIHPDDFAIMNLVAEMAQMAVSDFEFEYRLLMPNGSVTYLHSIAHAIRDQKGQSEYIGAVQDVTQRKISEEALARARAELAQVVRITSLGVMTASIAHEVNQPLSGIITNASTCLRMLNSDPPNLDGARETARRTIRDGNRASDVITRLRTLYSKKEPTLEPMDLNEAVREVIALLLSELQRNGAILQIEVADGLPIVQGDRVQLQQVIHNLVRNASDAMRDVEDRPRRLLIRTEQIDENVCVTVQDSGIGFDTASADRLFESFYTTKPEGMGIGLSVSRSIIEAHGGRLWATANDGPGATFAFSIPCGRPAQFDGESASIQVS